MLEVEEKTITEIAKVEYIERMFKHNKEAKFLTFNYTHTLENVYAVSSKNILHIHGNLGEYDLIFGNSKENIPKMDPENFRHEDEDYIRHKLEVEEYNKMSPEDRLNIEIEESNLLDFILPYGKTIDFTNYVDMYNEAKKDWIKPLNLDALQMFIKGFSIDEFFVIGHSIGYTDERYFLHLEKQYPKAKWNVYCYEPNGVESSTRKNFKRLFPQKKKDISFINVANL